MTELLSVRVARIGPTSAVSPTSWAKQMLPLAPAPANRVPSDTHAKLRTDPVSVLACRCRNTVPVTLVILTRKASSSLHTTGWGSDCACYVTPALGLHRSCRAAVVASMGGHKSLVDDSKARSV